jgi:hypothetical protein
MTWELGYQSINNDNIHVVMNAETFKKTVK